MVPDAGNGTAGTLGRFLGGSGNGDQERMDCILGATADMPRKVGRGAPREYRNAADGTLSLAPSSPDRQRGPRPGEIHRHSPGIRDRVQLAK